MPPEYEEKLSQLFQEIFSVDLAGLDGERRLMDLDTWDSLTHMQFVVSLEGEFGFELTGDEIADMESVGDVRRIVEARAK